MTINVKSSSLKHTHTQSDEQVSSNMLGSSLTIIGFLLLHVALGVLNFYFKGLSTFHVYLVIGLGIFIVLTKPPVYAAYISIYIVGSEVLWRMTDANFFWEGGKYAVILILGLSLFHRRQKWIPILPLSYITLLTPSIFLTFGGTDLSSAREQLSFNLSGPLALFVSAWFFSSLKLRRIHLVNLLIALAAPIGTIATYAILITLSTTNIIWVNDSNYQTSGGFGPNQVSAIMGLGIVAVWLLFLLFRGKAFSKILLVLISSLLLVQGFLTFSRGGLLTAAIVIGFISLHTVQDRKQRNRTIFYVIAGFALLVIFVLPSLESFTQGALQTRFTDTNLTQRDVILGQELQVFLENPIAGVGPGMGNLYRNAAAHTELIRLLAEHGMLGFGALLLLITMFFKRYFSHKNPFYRGLYGSFMLWSLITMIHAAMRLAAVSFTFGLAFAEIELDDSP